VEAEGLSHLLFVIFAQLQNLQLAERVHQVVRSTRAFNIRNCRLVNQCIYFMYIH
jgi:hypothetical protein